MPKLSKDTIEIIKHRADIVQVVGRYVDLKGGHRGKYKGLCPFHAEKTASFTVDGEKQMFFCFGCNAGGDVFTFVQDHFSMRFDEVVAYVGDMVGISVGTGFDPSTLPPPPKRPDRAKLRKRDEAKAQRTRRRYMGILRECARTPNDLTERYLASRGLAPEAPDTVCTHGHLYHREQARYGPAMVGMIQQSRITPPTGIQRVFLRPDGQGKAPYGHMAKKMLGSYKGGAVWMVNRFEFGFWPWYCLDNGLPESEYGEIWIGEGITTCVALYQYLDRKVGGSRAWLVASALNANNLGDLTIPQHTYKVIIAADRDRSQTGEKAAAKAAKIYQAQGYEVEIKIPPLAIPQHRKSVDWLDAINLLM